MTVFVAGATGFLGRHLARLLVERQHEVRALVLPVEDDSALRALGVHVVRGELADAEVVRRAAAGCPLAFNCVGLVSYERRDLARLQDANVESVRRLLAALDPETRLVHVSSLAAVGPAARKTVPATAEQVFPPEALAIPYCVTKRLGEQLVHEAVAAGRDAVIANPAVAFGPGDIGGSSTWPVTLYLRGRLRATSTEDPPTSTSGTSRRASSRLPSEAGPASATS